MPRFIKLGKVAHAGFLNPQDMETGGRSSGSSLAIQQFETSLNLCLKTTVQSKSVFMWFEMHKEQEEIQNKIHRVPSSFLH